MRRIVSFIWILLLVAVPAIAAENNENRVKSVKIEETESEIRAIFKITHPEKMEASQLNVQSDGNLFWVELPNTVEKKQKRIFYDWKCESLKGVGLKKVDKDTVALRVLFQDKSRPKDISWTNSKIEGKRLVMTFLKKEPSQIPVVPKSEITIDESELNKDDSLIESPVIIRKNPIDLDAIFGKTDESSTEEKTSTDIMTAWGGSADAETKMPGLSTSAVKFLSALLIVIGLMFAVAWLAKKYNLPQKLSGGGQNVLRVVGSTMLGMKKQVAVIDVAGQYMVVGLGQSTITMLGKVDDPKAIERLEKTNEKSRKNGDGFQQMDDKEEPFVISESTDTEKDAEKYLKAAEESEDDNDGRFVDILEYQNRQMKKAAPDPDPVEDPATIRTIKQRLQKLKRL